MWGVEKTIAWQAVLYSICVFVPMSAMMIAAVIIDDAFSHQYHGGIYFYPRPPQGVPVADVLMLATIGGLLVGRGLEKYYARFGGSYFLLPSIAISALQALKYYELYLFVMAVVYVPVGYFFGPIWGGGSPTLLFFVVVLTAFIPLYAGIGAATCLLFRRLRRKAETLRIWRRLEQMRADRQAAQNGGDA